MTRLPDMSPPAPYRHDRAVLPRNPDAPNHSSLRARQQHAESEARRDKWELQRLQRADRVRELTQAGHDPDAIAAQTGLPLSRVRRILNEDD